MTNNITIGTKVHFDSDNGPQRGRIVDFMCDVGNGQRIALVDVPGTLNGMPWAIPVNDLKSDRAAA
ncbi:MAG TPA: hypothetical protein VGE12_00340 [Noviherbaspirillum sp.]